jgi:hypothetical protein
MVSDMSEDAYDRMWTMKVENVGSAVQLVKPLIIRSYNSSEYFLGPSKTFPKYAKIDPIAVKEAEKESS